MNRPPPFSAFRNPRGIRPKRPSAVDVNRRPVSLHLPSCGKLDRVPVRIVEIRTLKPGKTARLPGIRAPETAPSVPKRKTPVVDIVKILLRR